MTLLPLITSSKVIENRVIYLVFWILNECIYIGTRKVIYTEYLFGFMRFLIQCFLGTWYCSKAIPSGGFMRVSCTLNRVPCHHFRWCGTLGNNKMKLPIGISLITWISLQAKTTLFMGQNLNAKTTLILGWGSTSLGWWVENVYVRKS